MTDGTHIPALKQLIWKEAHQNLQTIVVAKTNINFPHDQTDVAPYMWVKLYEEVKRLKVSRIEPVNVMPLRRQYPVKKPGPARPQVHAAVEIEPGTKQYDTKTMRERYEQAHIKWFQIQYPHGYKDGHYLTQKYPDVTKTNGITDLVINYLTWMGHFANRTNNKGTVRPKYAPKYSLGTGKVESVLIGNQYIKSTSKRGMQDVDSNLKHPAHPYGIPWKIEVKCRVTKDSQSTHQEAFAAKVEATGAVYSLVRDDVDFFMQYDGLMKS